MPRLNQRTRWLDVPVGKDTVPPALAFAVAGDHRRSPRRRSTPGQCRRLRGSAACCRRDDPRRRKKQSACVSLRIMDRFTMGCGLLGTAFCCAALTSSEMPSRNSERGARLQGDDVDLGARCRSVAAAHAAATVVLNSAALGPFQAHDSSSRWLFGEEHGIKSCTNLRA